ncbi:MAG: transcriptional regulator [Chitinophagaceae bacterium]
MFKKLDPLLRSQLWLALTLLIKEKTNATAGNLSVQINKLKEAGYLGVTKQFKDNYPQTICRITPAGIAAFDVYVKNLQTYFRQ